jgi:hypothetical protein
MEIADLIPPDAFAIELYKHLGGTGAGKGTSLQLPALTVTQVTVKHHSSVQYHSVPVCIAADADTKIFELAIDIPPHKA